MHTSDTFVIAKGIAPAALIQDMTSASCGALTSLLQYRPAVWDNPTKQRENHFTSVVYNT